MKTVTINSKILHRLLASAFKAVSSRPIIPALSGVLVSFDKQKLSVTGSSGSSYLTVTENGSFGDEIEFCVERQFLSFLSALPDQPIKISAG